jgi:uncharacterized protein YwbE
MRKGMVTFTVRLHDGTIGRVTSANTPLVGYAMTVTVEDDSREQSTATGVVTEILEKKPRWM